MSLTVKLNGPVLDPVWQVDDLGLEDIVLAYLGRDAPAPLESLESLESAPEPGPVR